MDCLISRYFNLKCNMNKVLQSASYNKLRLFILFHVLFAD